MKTEALSTAYRTSIARTTFCVQARFTEDQRADLIDLLFHIPQFVSFACVGESELYTVDFSTQSAKEVALVEVRLRMALTEAMAAQGSGRCPLCKGHGPILPRKEVSVGP